jgi:hypothetical protein
MEPYRLKIKVGPHEFEAEGSEASVAKQFEAWKELIGSLGTAAPTKTVEPDNADDNGSNGGVELPSAVFRVDRTRRMVSLSTQPSGEHRNADAILLIIYGYARAFDQEFVQVTTIKESMATSGLTVDRVDRAIAPHIRANFIRKGGTAKGSRFRLTNTGLARAEELVRELSE